ncbi:MAG: signal peptidase II [Ignavibacteria bacterium CG2_30_36_16]|nr:signal peptidase II [Ignavibacteria bacterium]OIP59435.1 MAG: signal peptidase II [Ignavibacteria bacterium CG2_30_36_16]PJB01826.1 MAG: signal peptidase II [Ignavibacteria bacterium CG_4_9_14_3_um_filter_36_18]
MRVLFVSLFVVIIDQVSKLLIKGFSIPAFDFTYHGMYQGERIPVIGDFLRITFIENPGMAFGFDPGSNFKMWVSLFSLFASIGLLIYIYIIREQQITLRFSVAFILGGAVGNLIDRVFYGVLYDYAPVFFGSVVDFIDVDFFDITVLGVNYDRWPIFNFADAAVSIGVLMLIIFYKKHTTQEEPFTVIDEESISETTSLVNNNIETNSGIVEQEEDLSSTRAIEDQTENGESDNRKEIPL